MIRAVVPALRCPICAAPFEVEETALRCRHGHTFDLARQGYANLLTGRAPAGAETAEMVAARADFLAGGHYAPIAAAVAELLSCSSCVDEPKLVAEVGAGTGYYLAAALDSLPCAVGLALDSSARAARRAAAAHTGIGSVVADAWSRLPVRSGAADAVLSVFAPRNGSELARILCPGGRLVVVTPNPEHLGELIGPLRMLTVGADKDSRLSATLGGRFRPLADRQIRFAMALGASDVRDLVLMGPAAHHVDRAELVGAVAGIDTPVQVSVDVRVSVWAKIGDH
jgi:23S rRNA (guanine745-N1)-methyltransferase